VKQPVLYHIEISHFNEKARWALDYKHVAHVRKAPPPLLHMAWAYVLTRDKTFPILALNGQRIGDSTRIIEALERAYPDPPLYPAEEAERRRALELEDFFDEEVAPHLRRVAFHDALESDLPLSVAVPNASPLVRRMFSVGTPIARPAVRLRYGIRSDEAERSREKTKAGLDRLAAELQPSGYLVGERFTVADLTAAALLFPLVRPPEAEYMIATLPPRFASYRDSLSSHPAFEWVREMYSRHRGTSAEVR
jgi:glutathione S-transferase